MAKTRKRVFALLMTLVMVLGLLPTVALAEGPEDRGRNDKITVYVQDQNGHAVSKATVTLEWGWFGSVNGETDSDGKVIFSNTVWYETYKVTAEKNGAEATKENVKYQDTVNLTLNINSGSSEVGSRDNPQVRFYVLDPDEGEPNNNNNTDKGDYYPNSDTTNPNADGGISGLNADTGYTGGSLTEAGKKAIYGKGETGIFSADGSVFTGYFTAPSNLGMFNEKEIIWYSMKEYSNGDEHNPYWYCNIDGYVADKNVNIYYYSNFDSSDNRYYETSGITGEDHTVLSYADTELPKQDGYVFTGWNTERDGSGTDYDPEDVFTVTGTMDLFAQWEQTAYTVEYKWMNGSATPSGVLPSTETVTYPDYDSYTVATPTTPSADYVGFDYWYVDNSNTSEKIEAGTAIRLADYDADDDQKVTLYAYCQQLGSLTVTKTFSYDGATPDADDVTNSVPKNFAATLTLTDGTHTYSANYSDGKFEFPSILYGTYTVTENVTAGGTIGGTKGGQTGTLTYSSYDLTSVTIDAATNTKSITNSYTFAADDTVIVQYEWGTEGQKTVHADVVEDIDLPETETYYTDASETSPAISTYAFPTEWAATVSGAELPDGYSLETQWYKDEDCTEEASVEDIQGTQGGTTVTLYAKLVYSAPNYELYYYLNYGENDNSPVGTGLYVQGTMPVLETYTLQTVFNAVSSCPVTADTPLYHLKNATTNELEAVEASSVDSRYLGLTYEKNAEGTAALEVSRVELSNGVIRFYVDLYAHRDTIGDLTITKTFSGIEALPEDFQITLTFEVPQPVIARAARQAASVVLTTGADSDVAPTVSGKTYTWVLEDFPYDTELTVTESNYEVDGYSVGSTIEGQTGTTAEVTFTQANDTIAVVNDYTGAAYRVIFLAGDHGVMNITTNSTAVAGDYTRYIWATTGTPEWRNVQPAGVKAYNKEAHYDFTQDQLDAATATLTTLNAPGVTADEGWTFQGFYLVQDGQMTNEAYQNLARVMALFQEQKVSTRNAETPVLVFQADYSQTEEPYVPPTNPPEEKPSNPPQFPTDLPDEDVPTTDLPDEDVPQTDLPDEDIPTTDLPDEDVPQTDLPDEDVPMAEAPKTGDNMTAWVLAAGISGIALVWLAISGKKHKEDNAQ